MLILRSSVSLTKTAPPFNSISIIMHFITLLAAAAAVSASPIERQAQTVPVPMKRVAQFVSIKNIVEKGQGRIQKVNGGSISRRASSGAVTNEDVTYVAPVKIGSNTWQLIVDTGCKLNRTTPAR